MASSTGEAGSAGLMEHSEPFCLFDCSLVRCATGRVCSNLRELLDALRIVPDAVLEHHLMRCALEDHFELYEFPNDLARWCWTALGDHVLGEQLSLVDPYRQPDTAALRALLVNTIEDRLWWLDRVPWCRPGLELHLVQSLLDRLRHRRADRHAGLLLEAIERMPVRSLFFHVHEARRRTQGQSDDFSLWLRADAAPTPRWWRKVAGHRLLFPQPQPTAAGAGGGVSALPRGGPGHPEDRPMKLLDRYEEIVGHREVERLRRLAGRLAGKRDRARQLDAERRRRGRNPRLDDAADAGIGDRRPLGSDHRPARLLPRHQGLSQRLAGPAGRAEEGRFRPALRGQPGERRSG